MDLVEKVLNGKYRLLPKILPSTGSSICRIGLDEFDTAFLVKLWKYNTDEPDELIRALWDSELRTLYRVSSSPGADDSILVIRDARLDRDAKAFVMVLQSSGASSYETLAELFSKRNTLPWLSNRDASARREMWSGLQRICGGLRLLHHQNVLHRNLVPETVFVDGKHGVSTLRLGGFEWSLRLGVPQGASPPIGWSSPPELLDSSQRGYRPETDWFAFGMLAIRCFLNIEEFVGWAPKDRHSKVLTQLEHATSQLSDIERHFLLRLIALDPRDRISHGNEISTAIQNVIEALDYGSDPRSGNKPLVLVIDPSNDGLLSQCENLGFVPNPDQPTTAFNPLDIVHNSALNAFIQNDLVSAQLYAIPNSEMRLLVGGNLILKIAPFQFYTDTGEPRTTWDLAYCMGPAELRKNEGGTACKDLPDASVAVRTRRQILKDRTYRQQAQSWEPFLPAIDRGQQLRASLGRFHEFIRCTNQLELLIRDAEIFAYQLDSYEIDDDGVERASIHEVPRRRLPLKYFRIEGGLLEFLHREIETNKQFCNKVVLTPASEDGLYIPGMEPAESWIVSNFSGNSIQLVRGPGTEKYSRPSDSGNIRGFGMFGQVDVIRRRKRAIDRLETHSYLLRSLSSPGQVYMDTGETSLPVPLNPNSVDVVKQSVMKDILRVRPIYALQGPPGTGKTTLVAHLVRQILHDDPVAQILITAQAHGAVDVLRAKVRNEAFRNVPDEDQPLAVRLGKYDKINHEGSVVSVCAKILRGAIDALGAETSLSAIQHQWLSDAQAMLSALESDQHGSSSADFVELVRRGANLTYCTTSAGDLEELADGAQSFDWSIVEESGKAHGFDLALPLQAGHRWLLIGDQKQLPPYRIRDYRDGIDNLDEAVNALTGLHERAATLIDFDWIRSWKDSTEEECESFKEYTRRWLEVFEHVFQYCRKAPGIERMTTIDSSGAAAGMLSHQYRMHPVIGQLISESYYDNKLVHKTQLPDGEPDPDIMHPFTQPTGIAGCAVVWLDVPWCQRDESCEEHGPHNDKPRYTNPCEIIAMRAFLDELTSGLPDTHDGNPLTIVALSPYSQQVRLINHEIGNKLSLPKSLRTTANLRSLGEGEATSQSRLAHTVDSFQGNEADIVLVSLVRNNSLPPEDGLGFLEEAPRINVMLSRAEQLLVLVGSWEFFLHKVSTVRLEDTHHALWHLKRVLTTLGEYFACGKAVRLSAKLK